MRANKSIKILSLIGLACTLTGVLFAGSSANGRPIESAFYNPTPARVQTVAVSGWKAKWQNLKLEAKQAANKWEARLQRKWQTFRTAYATKVSNSRMPASISKAKAAPQLTPAQKEFSQIIKQTKKITKQSAIQVVTPARPGTTALPKTESGVPVFSFQHVSIVRTFLRHRTRSLYRLFEFSVFIFITGKHKINIVFCRRRDKRRVFYIL